MKKLLTTALIGVLAMTAVQVGASAQNTTSSPTYTACANDDNGKIRDLAEGAMPLKPCAQGHTQVTLGAGDITAVVAGTGLLGGGADGEVSLSLNPDYRLPQGCSDGQVVEWDNSGGWTCAETLTDTDELGKYAFFVGIGQLAATGPTQCANHGAFTSSNDQLVNQPPVTIPAGRYLVVADDVRWDISQNTDINDSGRVPIRLR